MEVFAARDAARRIVMRLAALSNSVKSHNADRFTGRAKGRNDRSGQRKQRLLGLAPTIWYYDCGCSAGIAPRVDQTNDFFSLAVQKSQNLGLCRIAIGLGWLSFSNITRAVHDCCRVFDFDRFDRLGVRSGHPDPRPTWAFRYPPPIAQLHAGL
jgi:hypothetical protein